MALKFEELFLPDNFSELSKKCQQYVAVRNKLQTQRQPLMPSVMAQEMGLKLEEFLQLVDYFDNEYQTDINEFVNEAKTYGNIVDPADKKFLVD